MAVAATREITRAKYLLLKHYRGGPEPIVGYDPIDQWTPEEVEAHIAFMQHVVDLTGQAARLHPTRPEQG